MPLVWQFLPFTKHKFIGGKEGPTEAPEIQARLEKAPYGIVPVGASVAPLQEDLPAADVSTLPRRRDKVEEHG